MLLSIALAEFDLSVFQKDDFYLITFDDSEEDFQIAPKNFVDYLVSTKEGLAGAFLTIDCTYYERPTLYFSVLTTTKQEIGFYEAAINIDEELHYLIQLEFDFTEEEHFSAEDINLPLGYVGFEMLQSIGQAQSVSVKLTGREGTINFALTKNIISGIQKTYDDYVLAQGVNPEDAALYDERYPILVNGEKRESANTNSGGIGGTVKARKAVMEKGEGSDSKQGNSPDGKETIPQDSKAEQVEAAYIGNIKSKKFHTPSCANLPAEQNQTLFSSRDEATGQGYEPCGGCKP